MWKIFDALSTLFPASCINCKKAGVPVCGACLENCRRAVDSPFTYATCIYSFKDPLIKKIIHAIKYFHRSDLIEPLVAACIKDLRTKSWNDINTKNSILVPIPVPSLRKYMRGYNQAERIAEALGKHLLLPVENILMRTRTTKRQVDTATKSERLANQEGSFKVKSNVTGKNIIIVDDVTTTGATISEARKILLKANAHDVLAIAIAH